jgi:hypothetical protein
VYPAIALTELFFNTLGDCGMLALFVAVAHRRMQVYEAAGDQRIVDFS